MRYSNQIAIGKPTGKRPSGGTSKLQERIVKWILNEKCVRLWTTVIWFRMKC
jgi:hypothetical protein